MRAVVLLVAALALTCASAKADIIYQATTGGVGNFTSFAPDGTPNPPVSGVWEFGETVALGGTARVLDSISLLTWNGFPATPFTIYIYAGSDPNSGALLGSSIATVDPGENTTTFNFGDLVLPNTVTFIISDPNDTGSYDTNQAGPIESGAAATIGTGTDSLWYGPADGSGFVANSTWAVADGAPNNFLNVEFNARVPEPGFYGALGAMMGGLFLLGVRRRCA